jgi:sugar phosphate isomerase/epimerase
MVRTAVQLYTLRDLDESLPDILTRVNETSLDGIEFAHRFRDSDTEAIVRALDQYDFDCTAHVGIASLETDLEGTLEPYREIGCETIVVPWLDAEHFVCLDSIDAIAARLTDLAESIADYGMDFCYHNHDHELVDVDNETEHSETRTALHELVERTGDIVGFEVDTGWIAAGGTDPVAFIEMYSDRISMVHVTDSDTATGAPVEVGDGDVDVVGCLETARAADVEWLVYEHDEPTDPLSSLHHGSEFLSRHLDA